MPAVSKKEAEALKTALEAWVSKDRVNSVRGGYPEVQREDLSELFKLIQKLVSVRWESDADGDLPIQVELTDRTVCWPPIVVQARYEHKAKTEEEAHKVLLDNLWSYQVGLSEISSKIRGVMMHLRELEGKDHVGRR